jgi:hypothetical protein
MEQFRSSAPLHVLRHARQGPNAMREQITVFDKSVRMLVKSNSACRLLKQALVWFSAGWS